MAEQRVSPRIEDDDANVDEELQRMQARLHQMEAEKNAISEGGSSTPKATATNGENGEASAGGEQEQEQEQDQAMDEDEPGAVDARSIYIGNVDYGATPEEIQAHFQACGTINRVTILCDKFTGHPKGYAYVEFAEPSIVQNALVLNESMFRGRLLMVKEKRTNLPGMNMTSRGRGRGRGFRGGYRPYRARGRGRGRGW